MKHLPIARLYFVGIALIAGCTAMPVPCDIALDPFGQCERGRDAKQFVAHPTGPEPCRCEVKPGVEPDRLTDYDGWRDWRERRDADLGITRDWDEVDRRNGR